MLHADNLNRLEESSLQIEAEDSLRDILSKELEDKTRDLSQINGEELEALGLDELMKLERQVERGQTKIRRAKGEKLRKEIVTLKGKEIQTAKENEMLKEQMKDVSKERLSLLNLAKTAESDASVPSIAPIQWLPKHDNSISNTFLTLGPPVQTTE
ncbi:hypothetical protein SOVF_175880 [Spinacia oleracea]|nr:hypothetical protein SOVF_175880 [Spinacia oleracea]